MRIFKIFVSLSVLLTSVIQAQTAAHIVISEVYGGGGNSGSTWKNDFIELYNPTDSPVNVTGWSIQYASASGTFSQKTMLSGIIQPKRFFLIQEAQGTGGSVNLPAPDILDTLRLSATQGKIVLARDANPVADPNDASVADFIGYGVVAPYEGSGPAPLLTNTTSAERKASSNSTAQTLKLGGSEERGGNGWDSNDNANDFVSQSPPNPQNSQSQREPPGAILAGIGTALFVPSAAKLGPDTELRLVLRGTSEGNITGLRIVKHSFFDWSNVVVDVSTSGTAQPQYQVLSDIIKVTGFSLGSSDSVVVRVAGLSAPDTTLKIAFRVETGAGSDSTAPVTPLPEVILYGAPRPIGSVKANDAQGIPLGLQKLMTVRGVVTATRQFGGPAYMQDASGGVAVFDAAFESGVQIGDEVTITGTVSQFNGLTELTKVTMHSVHSQNNTIVPLIVTCSQIARDGLNGFEQYEGMLVQVNRVMVRDTLGQSITSWTVLPSQSGANFRLTDATDALIVRVDRDVDLNGAPAPTGEFDIIGIVGQFVTAPPFVAGYQLMPRWRSDVLSKGPIISSSPLEMNLTSAGFDIVWETAKPGSSVLRYGRTRAYEMGIVGTQAAKTSHRLTLSGLAPASVYYVQAFSVSGVDTSYANNRIVSTASQGSTGAINVYFNKSVRAEVARGEVANGNSNLTNLLLKRIQGAQKSIDAAFYSSSGQPGQAIAQALIQAKSRGVRVRCIVERDNLAAGTGSTMQTLTAAGVAWTADDLDAVNAGTGLQHNKFFIFDHPDGASDQVWVWTGSWNPTDPGTDSDSQNAIEIQDKALAGAYALEFNEMWGSDSIAPSRVNSRFGPRKTDNTPHVFNIDGVPVELYFSPSDRTTSRIAATLARSWHSINLSLFTFTRSELATLLKGKKDGGVRVRALLDNGTDQGSQYDYLRTNGVDVLLDPNSGLLHHKYAVIDAELNGATQYVITGSHNWTSAAENSNNENTLILQSNRIANLYLQEFSARYKEAGGKDNIVVGVESRMENVPESVELHQNYPNPFNPVTAIGYQLPAKGLVRLKVYNLLGQWVATLVNGDKEAGTHREIWDGSACSSGIYYYELSTKESRIVRPMMLLK